jgi:tRNA 2-selenouridine synthase
MPKTADIPQFLELAQTLPVIDVRSPSEFRQGHIPQAENIALFNDEERAAVGTTYVQVGRNEAVLLGLELAGRKMRSLCEKILAVKSEQILVHCWRGGMRSQAMAWLFETVGKKCVVLEDGYKAFRRAVLAEMAVPRKLRILSGYTGSGKTEILAELKEQGQQVIDLEALAHHKGSAFGALGQLPQPSTEHFENMLFAELQKTDKAQPLWLEDESANIGKVQITPAFFAQMKQAETLQVLTPQAVRVQRLLKEYGNFDRSLLAESIKKVEKRLGYDKCKQALELCAAGDLEQVAKMLLDYYDKAYGIQISARKPEMVRCHEATEGASAEEIAKRLFKMV